MRNIMIFRKGGDITAINRRGSVYKVAPGFVQYDRNIVDNTLDAMFGVVVKPPQGVCNTILNEQVKRIQDNPFRNMGSRVTINRLPITVQNVVKNIPK